MTTFLPEAATGLDPVRLAEVYHRNHKKPATSLVLPVTYSSERHHVPTSVAGSDIMKSWIERAGASVTD